MGGIRSTTEQIRRARLARRKLQPWLMSFSALALMAVPMLHSEPVEALPPSVTQTVQQVQPVQAPPRVYSQSELAAHRALEARLQGLGRAFNGDVGIAVQDVQNGLVAHYDGNAHFPQQSVSKFWVALTALDQADRGVLSLHNPVTVRRSDLTLFNQPIAALVKGDGYTTTLSELMRRAMQQSDNTCNDFVLWRTGGPEAVRDFISRKGISGVRFGPGERVMQSRIAGLEWKPSMVGSAFYAARAAVPASIRRAAFERYVSDPVDGATPVGVVATLARLQKGELLSPASTNRLLGIMSNTRTGPRRLKGGLAPGWSLAHKTGTGQVLGPVQSGYNDIGIITGPDGRAYSVAVFIRKTSAPIPTRMTLMQNVTRAVIDYSRNAPSYNVAQSYWSGNGGSK